MILLVERRWKVEVVESPEPITILNTIGIFFRSGRRPSLPRLRYVCMHIYPSVSFVAYVRTRLITVTVTVTVTVSFVGQPNNCCTGSGLAITVSATKTSGIADYDVVLQPHDLRLLAIRFYLVINVHQYRLKRNTRRNTNKAYTF